MARSYLSWGEPVSETRFGAIAVLERGADPSLGHVGFLVGEAGGHMYVLGGNQSDSVSVAPFARKRLLALRWPHAGASEDAGLQAEGTATFDWALAHVLEMEGGFSDDPYDSGGPTNFGITLKVYAAWIGRSLDSENYWRLKSELQHISLATVHDIYHARYWKPSGAAELPAPLALMHFDASVNHGAGAAIRFLQTAVGAEADGEIGPETRARVAAADVARAIERYAELRRQRYRALPHFWRFGRGWLRRVERTLAEARKGRSGTAGTFAATSEEKGKDPMTTDTSSDAPGKWWGESMTIWGAILTAVSTVLPALGPIIGLDITPELIREAGGHVTSLLQALGGLVGILMTIYGRSRATTPLQRRMLTIRL
jgi:lysozyme family protein